VFDATYKDRKGFDPSFLAPGKLDGRVFLPTLSTTLVDADRKLTHLER